MQEQSAVVYTVSEENVCTHNVSFNKGSQSQFSTSLLILDNYGNKCIQYILLNSDLCTLYAVRAKNILIALLNNALCIALGQDCLSERYTHELFSRLIKRLR